MVATAIGAAVSIGGSIMSSNASKKAASQEAAAADSANATQLAMYNQTRADHIPYLGAGTSANNQLAYLMGITPTDPNAGADESATDKADFNPMAGVNTSIGASGSLSKPFSMSDFTADPGYQFRLDQGQKALERSAAAKGGLMSGAALKATTNFAQGTAAQEYGAAYDRYNTNQDKLYSRLAGISNSGQGAANTVGQLGQNTANQIGNNTTSAGSAQAAGTVGSANAWSTGLGQIGQSFMPQNGFSSGYNTSSSLQSGFDPHTGITWN